MIIRKKLVIEIEMVGIDYEIEDIKARIATVDIFNPVKSVFIREVD